MKYPVWLPPLLGFLTAVGPVSTDMYLPAFPSIEAAFGTAPGTAQITLATWFLGLAVGQMTQGTLSDRYGRRWPLLVGTGIYTVASAGCALSPDLWWLSVWRAVAAFGGSASMVIPRAVVRDLSDGHAAARMMGQLILVMGVAPILAPTLGGAVLGFATWHAIFWIAFAYGLVCVALVAAVLPDTLPVQRRVKLGIGGLLARFVMIGRERSFVTHAAVGGFAMFGMFAYLGGSPGVFIEHFHLAPEHYGMLFGTCAAGFILGSQINARILPRFGLNRVLRVGSRSYCFATVLMVISAFTGWGGLVGIFIPVAIAMSSNGFLGPNAAVGALSRHAAHAGSASALMGTAQFLLGAVSGSLVGVLTDGTPRPMAVLMLIGGIGAVLADFWRPRVWRHGSEDEMALIVGIPACTKMMGIELQHATPARYGAALMAAAGAIPILIPPVGEAQLALLDRLDGVLISGSPSNVEPSRYGVPASLTPGKHDPERDATTLPLIRAALKRGVPLLAICRGIQELNVALGGTLHQLVHEIAGRRDHRAGPGSWDEKFGPKHAIRLSGQLARIVGGSELTVNSLHEQAIDWPADGLAVEAVAEDGTIEGVRVASAPGFAFGVQWHPEHRCLENLASTALFRAFGEACRAWRDGVRQAA